MTNALESFRQGQPVPNPVIFTRIEHTLSEKKSLSPEQEVLLEFHFLQFGRTIGGDFKNLAGHAVSINPHDRAKELLSEVSSYIITVNLHKQKCRVADSDNNLIKEPMLCIYQKLIEFHYAKIVTQHGHPLNLLTLTKIGEETLKIFS